MFEKPKFLLHASVPKKIVHLTGLVFLYPMFVLNREEMLLSIFVIILSSWWLLRFVAYGLIGICVLLVVFGHEIAMIAWTTLIIGDGFAGLVGMLWETSPLPWNQNKSLAGSFAFFASSFIGVSLLAMNIYDISYAKSALLSLPISFVSAFIESLPISINDNLSVVIGSGMCSWICLILIGKVR